MHSGQRPQRGSSHLGLELKSPDAGSLHLSFSTETLPPREHLARSGRRFGCHSWGGAAECYWNLGVEARDAAQEAARAEGDAPQMRRSRVEVGNP